MTYIFIDDRQESGLEEAGRIHRPALSPRKGLELHGAGRDIRAGRLQCPTLVEPDGEAPRRSAAGPFLCDHSGQAAGDCRAPRNAAAGERRGLSCLMTRDRITQRIAAGLPRPDQALDRPAKSNDPGRNRGVCSPVVLERSPPGGHLRDGAGPGSGGGRRVARPRRPWPAHRRRLGHADHSLGQYQRPQHHDRGVRAPADRGPLNGSLPLEGEARSHPSTRIALTRRSRAAGHARWSSLHGCQTALSRFFPVFFSTTAMKARNSIIPGLSPGTCPSASGRSGSERMAPAKTLRATPHFAGF
jgi:hypothetical protein